jgi:alpha-N-arabinofuranosidase
VASLHFDVFHRHADRLTIANLAQTVNVLQSVLLTSGKSLILTPTYHVFAMNKRHHDAESLAVHLRTPAPAHGGVTTFSASASRKDGRLLLSLSNLDAERPLQVTLDLRGATYSSPAAQILTAPALDAHNTADHPEAVTTETFDGVRVAGSTLRATLPAHSFVTVDLRYAELP